MPSALYLVPRPHRRRQQQHAGQTPAPVPVSAGANTLLLGIPLGLLGAYLISAPILPGVILTVAVVGLAAYSFPYCPWTDSETGQPIQAPGDWPASNPICTTYETELPSVLVAAGITMIFAGLIRG